MKFKGRHYTSFSVVWKFVLTYLSVFAVSLSITGVYLYIQASTSAIDQAQIVMEHNMLQTRESIHQQIKWLENLSPMIVYDNKLQTFLSNGFIEDAYNIEDYRSTIRPFIENIMRQNRNIFALRIFMTNDTIPELYDSFYRVNRVADNEWYRQAVNNPSSSDGWRPLHKAEMFQYSFYDSKPVDVFSYYRKIFSLSSNELVGMMEIQVKESDLFQVLREAVTSELGNVFVVDANNTIVSSNTPSLYGTTNFIRAIGTANETVNVVETVDGARSIVISVPIDQLNCRIVGIFPTERFNEKVINSVKTIIFVLAASLIVLGAIIYVFTNALLGRLKRLVKAMKKVQEGSLDVSVPVKANDEFTQLALTFNHMTSRIHDLVETVYKIQLIEKEAELKSLEAQVNPHFLYNTLATIAWVARRDKSLETEQLAHTLAKFYRLVLSKGSTFIPLRDEMEMVKAYLHIQKFRFESVFDIHFDIDERIYACRIIKNLLQPIVENALIHGIEPKRAHGTIRIVGRLEEDRVELQIIDDGVGMNADTLKALATGQVDNTTGSGYALNNIRERLSGYYGENHRFNIFSKPGIGTVIMVSIPAAQ